MSDTESLTTLRQAVADYHMPNAAKALVTQSHMMMLCGVTAAGKNTIVHYLISHAKYEYVVSHTTRNPRQNHGQMEQNGVDYWFCTNEQMLDLVRAKAFVEVKAVHGDTFYGTSITSIERVVTDQKAPISEVDVQGALEFTRAVPELRPVFILPPNYEIWMERLGTRGQMTEGERQRRLDSAKMELQTAIDNRSFVLVVNHEVELTAKEIIEGIDVSSGTQDQRRDLARDLMAYIK